jgi:hypothetical protein
MRAEHESPETPRCRDCGRFMEVLSRHERAVRYRCCGRTRVAFRPQFVMAREVLR